MGENNINTINNMNEPLDILLLTNHVFSSKRKSCFLYLARSLAEAGNRVDFLTMPVTLAWIFKNNDRENIFNFLKLVSCERCQIGRGFVKNFSWPVLFPFKAGQYIFKNYMTPLLWILCKYLNKKYDLIVFESTTAVLLYDEIARRFPNAKIVYRPSDPIAACTDNMLLIDAERKILISADEIWLVNESSRNFYNKYFKINLDKALVINNPLVKNEDIQTESKIEKQRDKSWVDIVHIGVFPIDYNILKEVICERPFTRVHVIGPYRRIKSTERLFFYGSLEEKEWKYLVDKADIGLIPNINKGYINNMFGITGKVSIFMLRGIPIIAMNVAKEMTDYGVFVCENAQQVIEAIDIINKEGFVHYNKYVDTLRGYTEEKFDEVIGNRMRFLLGNRYVHKS